MAAENSNKTTIGKPFQKGKSGNPGGRPKKVEELTLRCQELTPVIIDRLSVIAQKGRPMESIKAGEIILAYGHGKPTQRMDIGNPKDEEFKIKVSVKDEV